MMNDITLGQYFFCDSLIHRLDPRTKLLSVIILMTGMLISDKAVTIAGYIVLLVWVVLLSNIPSQFVFKNLRPFFWLFAITLIVHILWTPGRTLFQCEFLNVKITAEGLLAGIKYSLRLAVLIIMAAILTLSTSPIELTDALEKLLKPLNKFRAPVHEIVMMLTLSLRFIPTLIEEAQRIKNAQLSRGASFDGKISNRVKSIIPLILPLFISAFRRADDLALAMDSRCYTGGDGRTSFKILKYKLIDYFVLIICSLLLVASILIR